MRLLIFWNNAFEFWYQLTGCGYDYCIQTLISQQCPFLYFFISKKKKKHTCSQIYADPNSEKSYTVKCFMCRNMTGIRTENTSNTSRETDLNFLLSQNFLAGQATVTVYSLGLNQALYHRVN